MSPPEASQIYPRLFISDVFTARNLDTLRELAITHVITVMHPIVLFPLELHLTTLHVPLDDLPSADLLSHLPSTTKFILDAMSDQNARLLVHCWQGVSRSPSVAAAFLIATQQMSVDQALHLLQSKRPIVKPNPGFIRQLKQYHVLLQADDDADCSTK